jgi:hypothetical protein
MEKKRVNRHCIFRRQKSDQEAEKIFKIWRSYNINMVYLECRNKSDTSIRRSNWGHHKSAHKISQQQTWKAWLPVTTENNCTGYCAHTSESSNVKVQNLYHGKQHYTYINCNHRRATTLYTLEPWIIKTQQLNEAIFPSILQGFWTLQTHLYLGHPGVLFQLQ